MYCVCVMLCCVVFCDVLCFVVLFCVVLCSVFGSAAWCKVGLCSVKLGIMVWSGVVH